MIVIDESGMPSKDNAAFHKRKDIQDSLTSAAHTLDYWPLPISTPLNILGLNANVFDTL